MNDATLVRALTLVGYSQREAAEVAWRRRSGELTEHDRASIAAAVSSWERQQRERRDG